MLDVLIIQIQCKGFENPNRKIKIFLFGFLSKNKCEHSKKKKVYLKLRKYLKYNILSMLRRI